MRAGLRISPSRSGEQQNRPQRNDIRSRVPRRVVSVLTPRYALSGSRQAPLRATITQVLERYSGVLRLRGADRRAPKRRRSTALGE